MKRVSADSTLPEGTRVYFDLGEHSPKGYGAICGISSRAAMLTMYIVRAETPLDDPEYPYSCFTAPNGCLQTPED
jgi:hypothetical protein